MKTKLTAVEYIEENFSSSKTLGELKQIIKDAKVLEKEQLEFTQSKMYSEEDMIKFAMFCQTDEFEIRAVNKGLLNEWFETIKKK